MPDSLVAPEFPELVTHVWEWFNELNNCRPNNGMSILPIPFSEIHAWMIVTDTKPYPWELDMIKKLDEKYITIKNEK